MYVHEMLCLWVVGVMLQNHCHACYIASRSLCMSSGSRGMRSLRGKKKISHLHCSFPSAIMLSFFISPYIYYLFHYNIVYIYIPHDIVLLLFGCEIRPRRVVVLSLYDYILVGNCNSPRRCPAIFFHIFFFLICLILAIS